MKKKNKEKSLFGFIFGDKKTEHPENLSVNEKETMQFYQEIKDSLESELTDEVKSRLAEKIPAYGLNDVIELFPSETNNFRKNEVRLAAAS